MKTDIPISNWQTTAWQQLMIEVEHDVEIPDLVPAPIQAREAFTSSSQRPKELESGAERAVEFATE